MLDTNRLIQLRKSRKLTQAEVAQRLNTSRPNYVRYERGNHQPPNEMLGLMAEIFGVSVDYLLSKTDDPTPPAQKEAPATFEQVEEAYIKMLAEEKGVSIEDLVLSEEDRAALRSAILALIKGYGK